MIKNWVSSAKISSLKVLDGVKDTEIRVCKFRGNCEFRNWESLGSNFDGSVCPNFIKRILDVNSTLVDFISTIFSALGCIEWLKLAAKVG